MDFDEEEPIGRVRFHLYNFHDYVGEVIHRLGKGTRNG